MIFVSWLFASSFIDRRPPRRVATLWYTVHDLSAAATGCNGRRRGSCHPAPVTGIALAKFVRITKLREDRRPRRETFFAEAVSGHCGSSRRFVGFACFAIVFLGCVASARASSGLDGITVG